MRKIAFVLLLFSQIAQGQDTYKTAYVMKMIPEVKEIMDSLKIGIRKSYQKDGQLIIVVSGRELGMGASFSPSIPLNDITAPVNDITDLVYKTPNIELSYLLDSILFIKKDTSKMVKVKARSHIAHEIAHYLQKDNGILEENIQTDNDTELKDHITAPHEFEAYSVMAYYFLRHYKKKELRDIMKSDFQLQLKCEMLINAFYKYNKPWLKPIFD